MFKPRIRYWHHFEWTCVGGGFRSFGSTPAKAYIRWRQKYDLAKAIERGYNPILDVKLK